MRVKSEKYRCDPFQTYHSFVKGDRVRLRTGKAKMLVVEVCPDGRRIVCQYLSSVGYSPRTPGYFAGENSCVQRPRPASDYVPWTEVDQRRLEETWSLDKLYRPGRAPTEKEESEVSQKLYQTKDGKFGTRIGTTGDGKLVLEIKGKDGGVAAYDAADVEEVVPYTVACREVNDGNQVTHWRAVKDSVAVGDVILQKGGKLLLVEALNTKKEARAALSGRKLVTEVLQEVAADEVG